MRIGIDVGGTHTDIVILDGTNVIASHKALTTADIGTGIQNAICNVLDSSAIDRRAVQAVMIGTTQFTNAVIERRNLIETAIIRIGLPSTSAIPPMSGWPDDLADKLGRHVYMVHGGNEYSGEAITSLAEEEIASVIADIKAKGLTSVAISSVFSPINPSMEETVKKKVLAEVPNAGVTASHVLGRLGLLERENAALLNAALMPLAHKVMQSFKQSLIDMNIAAPLYISQNDGTLMSAEFAADLPVLTFSSGPTNSMRGAAQLTGLKDAIVIDVGGTTADIGMLTNGFPRESSLAIDVGGVPTNFRMPDLLPLGLGGGTLVRDEGNRIGPDSVGHRLVEEGLCFGGKTLTTSDIAVAAGIVEMGDVSAVQGLDKTLIQTAMDRMSEILTIGTAKIKTRRDDMPVIAVGGGAFLVPDLLPGASEILRPANAGVANAIGAALAQVGGEVELLYSPLTKSRDEAVAEAKNAAINSAVVAGARLDSISIVDIDEVTMAYMANETRRLRVKAVGDLELTPKSVKATN